MTDAITLTVADVADHVLPVLLTAAVASEAWAASYRDYPTRAEAAAADRVAFAASDVAVRVERDAPRDVVEAGTDLEAILSAVRKLARVGVAGTGQRYAERAVRSLGKALS